MQCKKEAAHWRLVPENTYTYYKLVIVSTILEKFVLTLKKVPDSSNEMSREISHRAWCLLPEGSTDNVFSGASAVLHSVFPPTCSASSGNNVSHEIVATFPRNIFCLYLTYSTPFISVSTIARYCNKHWNIIGFPRNYKYQNVFGPSTAPSQCTVSHLGSLRCSRQATGWSGQLIIWSVFMHIIPWCSNFWTYTLTLRFCKHSFLFFVPLINKFIIFVD